MVFLEEIWNVFKSFLWVIIKYNWDYDKYVFEIFFTFKLLDIIMLELFLRIVINKIKIPKIFYYTNYKKKTLYCKVSK